MTPARHPDALDIGDLVDGELDVATSAAVEAHLAGCPQCAWVARGAVAAKRAVRGLPLLDMPATAACPAPRVHITGGRLEAFLDAELTPWDLDEVGGHLDGCAACTDLAAASNRVRTMVRSLCAFAPPSRLVPSPAVHLGASLSASLDGELDGVAQAGVDAHLDACPACASERAEVEMARGVVRALPSPPAGPVVAAVDRARRTRRRAHRRARPVGPRSARGPGRRVAVVVATAAGLVGMVGLAVRPTSTASRARPGVANLVSQHSQTAPSPDALSGLAPVGVPVTFGP